MMNPLNLIGRLLHYAKRHGIRMTAGRFWLSAKRTVSGNRLVLFYCDLADLPSAADEWVDWSVESLSSGNQMATADCVRVASVGYAVRKLQEERFARGARLWLLKIDGSVAAYGWTLTGGTIEPHFFPLGPRDVHLFDFFVFPEFRGRRYNCSLVTHILTSLASGKPGRVFIEAAEWNTPQLRSLDRMPFQRFGCARKFQFLGRTIVVWGQGSPIEEPVSGGSKRCSESIDAEQTERITVVNKEL
jgi:hypothetical protein